MVDDKWLDSTEAANGRALAASLEAIPKPAPKGSDAEIAAAKARGLMFGYHARWARCDWRARLIQPGFHVPIGRMAKIATCIMPAGART